MIGKTSNKMIGKQVIITTKDGSIYTGIYEGIRAEQQLNGGYRAVKKLNIDGEKVYIYNTDIKSIEIK